MRFRNEGFQQDGVVAVLLLSLFGEHPGGFGRDHGCQGFGFDPGQNEEAGVVGHEVEVFPALLVTPADDATNFCLGSVVAVSLSVASSRLPRSGGRSMRPSAGVCSLVSRADISLRPRSAWY